MSFLDDLDFTPDVDTLPEVCHIFILLLLHFMFLQKDHHVLLPEAEKSLQNEKSDKYSGKHVEMSYTDISFNTGDGMIFLYFF